MEKIKSEYINILRFLSIDAVENSNSGHPGMPMGMAEIATILWKKHLKHSPNLPDWPFRDRFVLSNGHGSMLLYSLLYLSGYDLTIDDLKNFRQMHSKTPGHPELGVTAGVEVTTGPLGQGLAAAVGMALSEKLLAKEFNRLDFEIVNNYTYVFLGDGCLMEGISHEACSLAGVWKLGKLICFYDSNQISIDGNTKGWFVEDTKRRFESYGWHVLEQVDGHNLVAIDNAIVAAKAQDKPSLIICNTIIGKGSPAKQGTAGVHGSPLGKEEVKATREALNWHYAPFEVDLDIKNYWDARQTGDDAVAKWQNIFDGYTAKYPELAAEFKRRTTSKLPTNWQENVNQIVADLANQTADMATRKAGNIVLSALAKQLPELIGGSADLTPSNLTCWDKSKILKAPFEDGRYIHFGVREFGMAAIINGISLYGGFLPFGASFLVFSDYCRPAIRLSAILKTRVIYVFTHDSIGVGEDGPTHQPVEHADSLRLIPNLDVWRPCDLLETTAAWLSAINNHNLPTAILLSRQTLPAVLKTADKIDDALKGGYIIKKAQHKARLTILATGSEVGLALQLQAQLFSHQVDSSVVSMPSSFVFDKQPSTYKSSILPTDLPIIVIEAGIGNYWHKYLGAKKFLVCVDSFGESAPAEDVFNHFGFNIDQLTQRALDFLHAD